MTSIVYLREPPYMEDSPPPFEHVRNWLIDLSDEPSRKHTSAFRCFRRIACNYPDGWPDEKTRVHVLGEYGRFLTEAPVEEGHPFPSPENFLTGLRDWKRMESIEYIRHADDAAEAPESIRSVFDLGMNDLSPDPLQRFPYIFWYFCIVADTYSAGWPDNEISEYFLGEYGRFLAEAPVEEGHPFPSPEDFLTGLRNWKK